MGKVNKKMIHCDYDLQAMKPHGGLHKKWYQ